jgi:hypothetical protein
MFLRGGDLFARDEMFYLKKYLYLFTIFKSLIPRGEN